MVSSPSPSLSSVKTLPMTSAAASIGCRLSANLMANDEEITTLPPTPNVSVRLPAKQGRFRILKKHESAMIAMLTLAFFGLSLSTAFVLVAA